MRRIPLCLCAFALALSSTFASAQVKISQVYGGGGNAQTTVLNDFIEIYNSGAPQDITGWSVQYAAAAGVFAATSTTALPSMILGTGQYLLVQEAAGTTLPLGQSAALPAANATGTIAMSATDFKVALVSAVAFLPTGTPTYAGNPTLVDFVGAGTANWNDSAAAGGVFSSTQNSVPGSNDVAIFRKGCGGTDTNNSIADWAVGFPSPKNAAAVAGTGSGGTGFASPHLLEPGAATLLIAVPRLCGNDGPDPAATVTADLTLIGGLAVQPLNDMGLFGDEYAGDGIHSFLATVAIGTTAGTKNLPLAYASGAMTGGGYINLIVTGAATPDNDNCRSAFPIAGPFPAVIPTSAAGGNSNFTGANAEYNPLASVSGWVGGGSGMSSRRGVWFTVVGTGNTMNATTCVPAPVPPDTIITVMCGTCDGLTVVASNDDMGATLCPSQQFASSATWCSLAGATYYLAVYPFSTGAVTTTFTLTVNDDGIPCSTAIPCTTCPPPSTLGATLEVERVLGPALDDGCDSSPNLFQDVVLPVTVRGSARGYAASRDADWYRFQAATTSGLNVSCTAQINGIMQLRQLGPGGVCTGNTTLAQTVSSTRCSPVTMATNVVAGTWYAIRWLHAPTPTVFGGDAAGGSSSQYEVTMADGGPLNPPANDACASAATLALSATYTPGSTLGATNDGTSSCDAGGRDVWYSVTLAATGTLNVDTCGSSIDTVLTLYASCGGAEIACNDDCATVCVSTSSCLSVPTLAAGPYRVRVSDKGIGVGGSFLVRATFAPDNDSCATATVITCNTVINGSTAATGTDVVPVCSGPIEAFGGNSTSTNGVWYKITPASAQTITAHTLATTPGVDTKIFAYTGTCAGLVCVTANDDMEGSPFRSKVAFQANGGQDYFLMVCPFTAASAINFTLTVNCDPTPANDDCPIPTALTPEVGGSIAGTTIGATPVKYTSTTAYPSCHVAGAVFDVWYSYTACGNANLTLNTCGALDTILSVHTACPALAGPNSQVAGACNDAGPGSCAPGSQLTVAVTNGTTYLIRVAHKPGSAAGGAFTLNWAVDGPVWYQDFDGDGFGNAAISTVACLAPAGFVGNNQDCNDNNAAIHPGATEICDTLDNDCNGLTDDADPGVVGQATWYQDFDGDGFGNPGVTQLKCVQPAGYVSNNQDCNDNNAAIHPGATEICDTLDNDCNGLTDDADPGVVGQATWYQDLDGDLYGNTAVTQLACAQPAGYVSVSGDCNDNNAAVNPGATEICNGIDDDCDGLTDEVCPSNDHCVTATAISDGSISGDNSIAGSEIGDLTCGAVTNDVWFLYTNTKTCTFTVTASMCGVDGGGATFDAVLHVFSGSCGALSLVACNNSFCATDPKVTFTLPGGQSAYIAVSAVAPGPGGLFKMVVSHGSASMSQIGPGCSDGGGPGPTLTLNLPPVLGAPRTLSVTGAAPASPGLMLFSNPAPAPSPITGGCNLYLDQGSMVFFIFFGTDAGGNFSLNANVPGDPAAECLALTVQGVLFPSGGSPFYQVTSGLGLVLGY